MGAGVNDMPVACQSRDRTEPAGENESLCFSFIDCFCCGDIQSFALILL